VELNRRVKRKRTSSAYSGQLLSAEENNNEENQSQRSPQQSTAADNKSSLNIRMSFLLYEGYSSVTSIDSRYLDSRRTNEKWKDFVVFMYTEPSIMFYSNIFLMVSMSKIDINFIEMRYYTNLTLSKITQPAVE